MHQTDANYSRILAAPYRVEIQLTIDGAVYGMDSIEKSGLAINSEVFGMESPSVGNCIARRARFRILAPRTQISPGATVTAKARIVGSGLVSSWIPKGTLFVDKREKNRVSNQDSSISISAFDAILKADVEYTGGVMRDAEAVAFIAGIMGVQYSAQLDRGYTISIREGQTCRDVLCNIASAYAGNWGMSEENVLTLYPLRKAFAHNVSAQSVWVGDPLPAISKVVLHKMDGTKFEAGTDIGRTLTVDCPFATQPMADDILSRVSGYVYTPFQATGALIDPAYEIGDTIQVGGVTECIYKSTVRYTTSLEATLSAPDAKEFDRMYVAFKSRIGGGYGGRLSAIADQKAQSAERVAVETYAGLQQITTYAPESGYAIAEEALYATILDNITGQIKTARISASVVRTADGQMKSLAQILADVITLQGNVQILGNLTVQNGGIRVLNNGVWCNTIRANYPDFEGATRMRFSQNELSLVKIKDAAGDDYWVIGRKA